MTPKPMFAALHEAVKAAYNDGYFDLPTADRAESDLQKIERLVMELRQAGQSGLNGRIKAALSAITERAEGEGRE